MPKNYILPFVAIALLQQSREEPQSESLSVLRFIEWAEIKTTECNQIPAMYKRYIYTCSRRLMRILRFFHTVLNHKRNLLNSCAENVRSTEMQGKTQMWIQTDKDRHDGNGRTRRSKARWVRSRKEGQYKQLARSCLRKRFVL